jgi:hypothetical protein
MRTFQCVLFPLVALIRSSSSFTAPTRALCSLNQGHHTPLLLSSASETDGDAAQLPDATEVVFDQTKHLRLLSESLNKASGETLQQRLALEEDEDWQDTLHMSMRFALLSHGAAVNNNGVDGPFNEYGNVAALETFSYAQQQQFYEIPAYHMASPGYDQEDLTRMYEYVKDLPDGYILNYEGFRCTQDQRRLCLRGAIVSVCVCVKK